MAHRHICHLCGRPIPPHAHYVVRIDVFADPQMPPMTTEEIEEMTSESAMQQLMEELSHLTAEELQDQVHRRFEYVICRPCQIRFLVNPLGLPRERPISHN